MKKTGFILFLLVVLYSCDPGYFVGISNRTNADKQITIYTREDSLQYFLNDSLDVFKLGRKTSAINVANKAYKTDTIKEGPKKEYEQYYRYLTILLPAGEIVCIGGGIGFGPSYFCKIITSDNDTINASEFPVKKKLFGTTYIYSID